MIARCPRCNSRTFLEYDDQGIATETCLLCGPHYGRREPTPEELFETRSIAGGRNRRPMRGGMAL